MASLLRINLNKLILQILPHKFTGCHFGEFIYLTLDGLPMLKYLFKFLSFYHHLYSYQLITSLYILSIMISYLL